MNALAGLIVLAAAGAGTTAFAGGAPSGYEACAGERQLFQQALAGQTTITAGVAKTNYEQCMKDHRYDGGDSRPPRFDHDRECRKIGSCS
jgi:hypothetical protein